MLSLITSLSWDYSVRGTREADPVPTDFPAWGGGNNQRPQRTLCEGRGAVYEEGGSQPKPKLLEGREVSATAEGEECEGRRESVLGGRSLCSW